MRTFWRMEMGGEGLDRGGEMCCGRDSVGRSLLWLMW